MSERVPTDSLADSGFRRGRPNNLLKYRTWPKTVFAAVTGAGEDPVVWITELGRLLPPPEIGSDPLIQGIGLRDASVLQFPIMPW